MLPQFVVEDLQLLADVLQLAPSLLQRKKTMSFNKFIVDEVKSQHK